MRIFALLLLLPLWLSACTIAVEHTLESAEKTTTAEAETAFSSQDYAKAGSLYQQLYTISPGNLFYQLRLADIARLRQNSPLAHQLYSRVLSHSSMGKKEYTDALEGQGLTYMQEGKFEEAVKFFGDVLKRDPKRWRTLNAIAVALALTNRPDQAMAYYKAALERSGEHPSVLNNMGLSLALTGNIQKGVMLLEKASATANAPLLRKRIQLNLALLYGISGRIVDAEGAASPYLSKEALSKNMRIYAKLYKNKALAKEYLRKALGGMGGGGATAKPR